MDAKLEMAKRFGEAINAETEERWLMLKLLSDARNLNRTERIRLRLQLIDLATKLIEYDKEGI